MAKPLEGIRILDLTAFLAGPFATQLLGSMGAEVIRVETPGTGAGERNSNPFVGPKGVNKQRQTDEDISMLTLRRCRNKMSITLNLKSAEGREMFFALVKRADVVVENFRLGTMEKLGIGYETLKKENPRLVYCSINGFGGISAYESMAALDITMQAFSGFMSTNGSKDGPPMRSGAVSMADMNAAMFAVTGILTALLARVSTGEGQKVSVNMLEPMLNYLLDEPLDYNQRHGAPQRDGSRLRRATPFSNFKAKNGDYVLAANTDKLWQRLLTVIGREDLKDDPRYLLMGERAARTYDVDDIINSWSEERNVDDVITALNDAGIPCAKVRSMLEVIEDQALIDAGALKPLVHPTVGPMPELMSYDNPIHFSSGSTYFDTPAPFLGQHNAQVYGELLGLSTERLQELKEQKII